MWTIFTVGVAAVLAAQECFLVNSIAVSHASLVSEASLVDHAGAKPVGYAAVQQKSSSLQWMTLWQDCHAADTKAPGWTRCHLPSSARYRRLPSYLGMFSLIGFGSLIIALFAAFVWSLGGNDIASTWEQLHSKPAGEQ
mmetsp:Transcript_33876/g.79210  ORF Transcript_33876/g.79210 Transcript_33876/m.79210 type:complete len:139 (-) Transcript_33876:100-516(-)